VLLGRASRPGENVKKCREEDNGAGLRDGKEKRGKEKFPLRKGYFCNSKEQIRRRRRGMPGQNPISTAGKRNVGGQDILRIFRWIFSKKERHTRGPDR